MSDILPPDANVTEAATFAHLYLRVDPNDPNQAEELRVALLEALDLVVDASDELLSARRRLLNAGYRDTHPVCKDIDRLAGWLADAVRYMHLHPDTWTPLWPERWTHDQPEGDR